MDIPVARRFICVVLAVVIAAVLLRPSISSALVVRGDELTSRASVAHALVLYRRAIWLEPHNGVAIDRYVFTSVMTHRRKAVEAGVDVGVSYLRTAPADATVIMDVAMGEEILGRYAIAARDFAHLGLLRSDPRAYTFAGFAALHAGRVRQAREWFVRAHGIDRRFLPASRALARLP